MKKTIFKVVEDYNEFKDRRDITCWHTNREECDFLVNKSWYRRIVEDTLIDDSTENVWHNDGKCPDTAELCLFEYDLCGNGTTQFRLGKVSDEDKNFIDCTDGHTLEMKRCVRWAFIKDLLPKE